MSLASNWAPHSSRRGIDCFFKGATLVLAVTNDIEGGPDVSDTPRLHRRFLRRQQSREAQCECLSSSAKVAPLEGEVFKE